MAELYIDISKDEWTKISTARISNQRQIEARSLRNMKFSFPLELKGMSYNNPNIFVENIEFIDCVFENPIEIGDYLCAGNLLFRGCTFEAGVAIESMTNVGFYSSCIFRSDFTIARLPLDTTIADIYVGGELRISGINGGKLIIKNVKGYSSLSKQKLTLAVQCKSIEIRDCTFEVIQFVGTSRIGKNIIVADSKIRNIDIFSVESATQFSVFNCEFGSFICKSANQIEGYLFLRDNNVTEEVVLSMASFKSIGIKKNIIKKVEFVDVDKKDSTVEISNLLADEILFNNIFIEGKFTLRQVAITRNGRLTMHSSNLGKTDFLLCDFENAILDFHNSKLTEVFLAETEFPKVVELNGERNHRQAQLAFGQISTAFQKQGDTVRSLEYQSREIEAHYRQLKCGFTKISLWLNKWSNDFGRKWQRAVLFSLIAGLLFFYLVVISSNEYEFGFGLTYDSQIIPSYFRFINPLRFFELESIFKVNQKESYLTLNGWSYFFDLCGRIFVAYGFYQTIQAFRKYGRK